MNPLLSFSCRVYQKALYLATFFMPFHEPRIIDGPFSLSQKFPSELKKLGYQKLFIVIDPFLHGKESEASLLKALEKEGVGYVIFTRVVPNPPFDAVEEGVALYIESGADSLLAIGGGSAMDTMKAIGARVANPKKDLMKLKGLLKLSKRPPFLSAAPTTAGTGSEATVAAVVVNPETKDKFSINDPRLIPDVAILDDTLLSSLPPAIIAPTGMDALTHAIESYIGHSSTRKSKEYALRAISLIDKNLEAFYRDSGDAEARKSMQLASYYAGVSFTRAYVGYVHALAHALGGYYNVPHGLANAILLPRVLEAYGKSAYARLAEVADVLGVNGGGKEEKAKAVISWIDGLNKKLGIPKTFNKIVRDGDLMPLAVHAAKEANPLYPVPKEFNAKELSKILLEVNG
ncbi:MAG: iron-containing alcohol dehydrogenase [Bacilli bacterium]|nr:iron-containing alcohol dehydrogenase [Bacilli bacterium]